MTHFYLFQTIHLKSAWMEQVCWEIKACVKEFDHLIKHDITFHELPINGRFESYWIWRLYKRHGRWTYSAIAGTLIYEDDIERDSCDIMLKIFDVVNELKMNIPQNMNYWSELPNSRKLDWMERYKQYLANFRHRSILEQVYMPSLGMYTKNEYMRDKVCKDDTRRKMQNIFDQLECLPGIGIEYQRGLEMFN
jgi:hypothetical protein